jgi:hypothetical protein
MGAVRLSFVLKEILVKHRLFTPQLAESCGVFFFAHLFYRLFGL